HVDLFAPGYFFLTTDTANLLRWLATEAQRAGAHLRWGARFAGAKREAGRFLLAGQELSARYILGADGARSAVARTVAMGVNNRLVTGLEAAFEGLGAADPRFLHCFLNSELAPGYLAWVAPGPIHAQVGLAVGPGRRPDLAAFLAYADPLFGFSRAHRVER